MRTVSIYGGHDSNVTFYDSEKNDYRIIEIERITKNRYMDMRQLERYRVVEILKECQNIAEKYWGFDNNYDKVITMVDGHVDHGILKEIFNGKEFIRSGNHHESHALVAYYQSNFDNCIVFSYDGGGNDGFFNVYKIENNNLSLLEKIDCDFGGGYLLLSSCLNEVTTNSRSILSLAGKMMGICAYGEVKDHFINPMSEFFIDRRWDKLSNGIGIRLKNITKPWSDPLNNHIFINQPAYDFARSAQQSYENSFINIFDKIIKEHRPENVCITGGGALNVLLNERLKNEYDINFFVPPNPNDCGLSLGSTLIHNNEKNKINVAYNGVPILDKENLPNLLKDRKVEKFNFDLIVDALVEGKILGVCIGDSEVGPRALGNRSIICNPNFKNMKDVLNSKVKFREWYRPFAPFCLMEDANNYFETKNYSNLEYMGYAPKVKDEWREKLPSITHQDGSSRLQTVTNNSHPFFYKLLKKFSGKNETAVLLNTSFNIKGRPILTTYEDCFNVLDNTDLDMLVFENFIVYK